MPGGTRAQWDEFNELQRRSTSPANAARFMRAFADIDVTEPRRGVVARRSSSTSAATAPRRSSEGRLLASLIPGSRFVSLEGDNHLMLADRPGVAPFLAEVDRFLAGRWHLTVGQPADCEPEAP